jgi:acyl-CoA reductase-like NAD-dependent aldehyde dehydrogenase
MSIRLAVPKMYKLFIGGKFTRTESERYLYAVNPVLNEKICNYSRASRKDLRNAVSAARSAFKAWSQKTAYERGQILYRLAEMLEGRKEQFINELRISTTLTPLKASKEVEKCIDRIIWFAGFSDKWEQLTGTVNPVQSGYFNFSIAEPSGIAGIILPDSPPLLSLVSRICPVIVSGNTCVILSSDSAPLPALSFAEVIATSDIPGGVVNILTGVKNELIPHLAGHMDINTIEYADNDVTHKRAVKELCTSNIKRFVFSAHNTDAAYFNDSLNETLYQIQNFTEIKTVWHTMGM